MNKSARHSTKSWHCVHSIWESLSINRQLDLLNFSVISLGEKWPLSVQELQFGLLDTARSILGYFV